MENKRDIALVDCDNFFVSCERIFRPDLNTRPVVVLSSNDGCVVSRSQEVKAMGVKMGEPWFKLQKYHSVITAFSSNFKLYADISSRVKRLLADFSPIQESYSIDESFLELTGFRDVWDKAFTIRHEMMRQLSIPVCIGIAPTKTLAKLANHIAKKHPRSRGVFSWNRLTERQKQTLLTAIPVSGIWGIGRRMDRHLARQGITTAWQLKNANLDMIRSRYGVILARLVAELRGEPCLDLVEMRPPRQQILSSRSFGHLVSRLDVLENAVAYHASHVSETLRKEKSLANLIQVFLQTDRFRDDLPQHAPQVWQSFPAPTDDTLTITQTAIAGLRDIASPRAAYKKAGVCLHGLIPATDITPDLFCQQGSPALTATIDAINQRFGSGTLCVASNNAQTHLWQPRKEKVSPEYTTRWSDFLICN
ncbi:MAG: Y-family DNA polymerase [Oxalobacter sp.]|nr:Y-family DNA polymerase [Oxalobacter sp.]